MRPRPRITHQISSTVRCATAFDTAPEGRVNIAIAPRDVSQRIRTSEPSAAMTSGAALIHLAGNTGEAIIRKTLGGSALLQRDVPDVDGVFCDRAVGRKPAHLCDV